MTRMSSDGNRTLARLGARELTAEELRAVAGAGGGNNMTWCNGVASNGKNVPVQDDNPSE